MRSSIWSLMLASILVLPAISGCAHRTQPKQQVAGKQETYQTGTPTKVTFTFTDNGITIDPSQIPPGDVQVNLVNNSSHNQTFSLSGAGTRAGTWTLPKGKTVTATIKNTTPGVYKFQVPTTGKGSNTATR